jgi:hypothetical protein
MHSVARSAWISESAYTKLVHMGLLGEAKQVTFRDSVMSPGDVTTGAAVVAPTIFGQKKRALVDDHC